MSLMRNGENRRGRRGALAVGMAVSVVLPVKDRRRWLAGALRSIVDQHFSLGRMEVIVVDDGSTDGSGAVAASFRRHFRSLRILRHRASVGAAAARNIGIRQAHGRYIAFLDSDDRWLPGTLEPRVRFLHENSSVDMIFADMRERRAGRVVTRSYFASKGFSPDSDRPAIMQEPLSHLLRENVIPLPTAVVRRASMDRVGLFDERFAVAEDWELWLRMAAQGRIACLPAVMLERNWHRDNLSLSREKVSRASLAVLKHFADRHGDHAGRFGDALRTKMAYFHQHLADAALDAGRPAEALDGFVESLRCRPTLYSANGVLRSAFSKVRSRKDTKRLEIVRG